MKKVSVLIIACLLAVSGCGTKPDGPTPAGSGDNETFYVYDLSDDMTHVRAVEYAVKEGTTSERVRALLQRIIDGPGQNRALSAIPQEISKVTYIMGADTVMVNFDAAFDRLPNMKKILCELAITDTLCQLDDVDAVGFAVEDVPISDRLGVPVGFLTPDSFVENDGALINAYEKAELHLFFTDETGSVLIEKVENITYNTNISMDRLIVENIISGPRGIDTAPTVNPSTVVNSVITRDGICYVNLNKEFLNKTTNVSDEVMVYSIVDSLSLLSNVNKVMILIDGSSDVRIGSIDLSAPLERNLEIIR